jgi:hypothetical protein
VRASKQCAADGRLSISIACPHPSLFIIRDIIALHSFTPIFLTHRHGPDKWLLKGGLEHINFWKGTRVI